MVQVLTVFFYLFFLLILGPEVRNILNRIVAGEDVSDFSDLSESNDEDYTPPRRG